jgi:hypothetical protein
LFGIRNLPCFGKCFSKFGGQFFYNPHRLEKVRLIIYTKWMWKIPYYWAIVHLVTFIETFILEYTNLIRYEEHWGLWTSYTWWWIFLLIFEWIGELIIPEHLRKPLAVEHLHFGKLGWAAIHIILIVTIFLAGFYLGKSM